jgi:hypothetical protein
MVLKMALVVVGAALIGALPLARTEQPQVAAGVSKAAPDPIESYQLREVQGFSVRISGAWKTDEQELLRRVLVHLEADLDSITHVVPAPALRVMRRAAIWVERQGTKATGRGGRGLCCHWSPAWLRANGVLEAKAGSVEVLRPEDYLEWRDQPWMLFHELAHAVHWRLPGLDAEIEDAFKQAAAAGLYDAVERNTLPRGQTVKAYAVTNSHEYFAELSEAYLGVNDFYPYTRRQLEAHDPGGFKLMERIWNLSQAELDAVTGPRPDKKESSPRRHGEHGEEKTRR